MASNHPDARDKRILLEYRLPTRIDELEGLSQKIDDLLADRQDLAFSVNLCLEELVTNTILHGLDGNPDRFIDIRISLTEEWLEIMLKDDAPRFDPFQQVPAPDLELGAADRPIGGLGVFLVKKLMDKFQFDYDGRGNRILLLKRLDTSTHE